jgi:hypothetical protein
VGRYWDATPYGAGQTSAGYFPRIVPAFGPPRANRGFTIVDGNRSQLAQTNAGGAKMHYIWTLCYSSDVPQPNGTLYGVTNWHTLGITFNLFESTPPTYTTIENPMDSDSFYMPDVGTVGKVRYLQMLVQQVIEDPITGHLTETGIYAASRGTWYGVAP